MRAFYLGTRGYAEVLRLQETIFHAKIARQTARRRGECALPLLPDVALLVEHAAPVYTLGRRDTSADLPAPGAAADAALPPAEVFRTRRGGGVTYHGPGQLTAYPVANVQELWRACAAAGRPRSPIEWFSAALERTMIGVAADYGVPTHAHKTGVWADARAGRPARKLGSIGLQLGGWVSMHGAGLNVTTDLRYFDRIVMCELPGAAATSLAEELRLRRPDAPAPALPDVAAAFTSHLRAQLAGAQTAAAPPLEDVSARADYRQYVLRSCGFEVPADMAGQ